MRKQLDEKRGEARRKKEEQDRVRAKFYWEDLGGGSTLPALQACKETAIEINGVKILNPVQAASGVIGHWMVADPSCVTHFDGFADKGCSGPGSGRRLIESRLWNLQGGDDWRDMCSTTPRGFPRGIRGVWGTWNIEDRECS
ncbi:hypothetical protein B0H14DRAFT_2990805 [Mycena olivaceomarginata]|nr:hypothetical protein B0H14DRAFT_2990805 [Mycena olivaceomarginata]